MTPAPLARVETVKLADLTLDPRNARTHDAANLAAIAASLEQFGQVKPIVITAANVVVAGNGTVAGATELGWMTVRAVRCPDDWTDEQVMAYAIADNRTAELAAWDVATLRDLATELVDAGYELRVLGFDELPSLPEPPDTPEPGGGKATPTKLVTCPRCKTEWLETDA